MSDASQGRDAPIRYELRVQSHLDPHWSAWFTGFSLTHEDDGTTSMRGLVTDQAQLHGLLTKIRDLGVTLVSVAPADLTDDLQPDPATNARARRQAYRKPPDGVREQGRH